MKNTRKQTVENIIDLIRWFEEYQPEDLEQIERILKGLKYVDKDIMENDLKQDIYMNTRLLKDNKYIEALSRLANAYRCIGMNNKLKKKDNNDVEI